MRRLIRPTLFLVARAGLFLAVVAWIVGQWWSAFVVGRFSEMDLGIYSGNQGWIALRYNPGWIEPSFSVERLSPAEEKEFFDFFNPQDETDGILIHRARRLPGAVISGQQGMADFISFRHWLIVTIFALFYAVLKWVYRKRPDEQPQD